MDKYLFDFWVMIERGLTVETRQPVFIAWIYNMISYFRKLYDEFIDWGREQIDEITWNSITINLENQLILKFGDGIYIVNNFRTPPNFLYETHDSRNILQYETTNNQNKFIWESGVYDPTIKPFTVFVPSDLVYDEIKMRAVIDNNKLLSSDYNIETY